MSKSERLGKQIDLMSKFIMFYMGLIVLIIGYAYQHEDYFPLICLLLPIALLYWSYEKITKDLKELENE